MGSNSFGNIFRITTWGEPHGKAIGVVIDGCPSGLEISEDEINRELAFRAPGRNSYTSSRKDGDRAEIVSGVFEGKTTGAPVSIIIKNSEADTSRYDAIKNLLRPGHANYTYLEKYGIVDYRGGGRASARETACRVAAGAIAKKLLRSLGIEVLAYTKQISKVKIDLQEKDFFIVKKSTLESPIFCPDKQGEELMMQMIDQAKNDGDSLGGIVEFIAIGVPVGIGDPVYNKLEADLSFAMMSIPASKGFEIGSGFEAVEMKGSDHNDIFTNINGKVETKTNYAGGVLGGISTGMPIIGRVCFKPTPSIKKMQETLTTGHEEGKFQLPEGSRHDPCIAIRAVPVVETMVSLVLADAILSNRLSRI